MRPLSLLLLCASLHALAPAQNTDQTIRLRPDSGTIGKGVKLAVYFPDAMVGVGEIGRAGLAAPLAFDPPLDFEFFWRSQSEGSLHITEQPTPGQTYAAKLAGELRTGDGTRVQGERWGGARFTAPPLSVTTRWDRRATLPQKPAVGLRANYEIRFAEAAETIYFQDRDSRERFPALVLLPGLNSKPSPGDPPAPATGSSWSVEPENALPPDRTIDLVIDGLHDAATGTALPFLKALPLGTTTSLALRDATTERNALEEIDIDLWFNQGVDPSSITAETVRVEPEVEGFKVLPDNSWLRLTGNFDPAGRYTVHLGAGLRAKGGHPLKAAVAQPVEFGGIAASIYFPTTQYFTRAGLGLNMKFLHANTGPARWRLAPLPEHKIGVARSRLFQTGEILVDQLGLQVVASGETPAAPTVDSTFRDVTVPGPLKGGAYLFEVSAETPGGKTAANRALVFFNDLYITQKETRDTLWAKVSSMSDSSPLAGTRVRLVTSDNALIETATTDGEGIAKFSSRHDDIENGHLLADVPGGGTSVAFRRGPTFYNSGYPRQNRLATDTPVPAVDDEAEPAGVIFSDRNLYRPGTTAKFKGVLRLRYNAGLQNAAGASLDWKITKGFDGDPVATGNAQTDAFGGWEIEWPTDKNMQLGGYYLSAQYGGEDAGDCYVRVEEYRVPLFEVALAAEHGKRAESVRVRVQSNYFHGGPNAGAVARWAIDWNDAYLATRGSRYDDRYSQQPLPKPPLPSASGELRLDDNGTGWIEVAIPEAAPRSRPRYRFSLDVDVISPEGQSISDGFYGDIQPSDNILSVGLAPDYENPAPRLAIRLAARDAQNRPTHGMGVEARVFRVEARTVKEQLGDGLFRYRNFDEHLQVGVVNTTVTEGGAPQFVEIGGRPGRYVVVARFLEGGAPRVSMATTVAGEAPVPYPVYDDHRFEITADKEEYLPGDTATLALQAPFGGRAWVSVETDLVLDQFAVDLDHNATKIELPIKPEYFPNAHATVHLVRPATPGGIPAERFGRLDIEVLRPDLHLAVEARLGGSQIEPGQRVTGEVFVRAGGEPLADADLTVMAVDEAVLRLGAWSLPDVFERFYPWRPHRVATRHALFNHHSEFSEEEVTEKGFLIGGGGPGGGQGRKKPRENFLARAFWKTGLRTDAQGKVEFDFVAPDNLTEFRLTAFAMTKDNRFGHGETEFKITKRLMIEPALPRFVRAGDEVVLRGVARQSAVDEAGIDIACTPGPGLDPLGHPSALLSPLARDVPGTFGVRARVGRHASEVKVRFDASIAGHPDITDSVEVTIPVHRPGIMQRTGLFGQVPDGADEFILAKVAPAFWETAEGEFGLTVSRTPFLPKLQGLPEILDYPHGCLEQRSSRLLAYTQLAALLKYLPELGERHRNYRERIESGLRYFARHQRGDGLLRYWGSAGEPNAYATVQTAWVAAEAKALGYAVPESLEKNFARALDAIIRGRVEATGSTRAFALYVQGRGGAEGKPPLDVFEELNLQRDRLGDEARAFLALAMHRHDIMPAERTLLVREIDKAPPKGAFNPIDFYSPTRAKAVAYIAQTRIADPRWVRELEPEMRTSLFGMLDDSRNLSTQENLWLLMAMATMLDAESYKPLAAAGTGAELASENRLSIAWKRRALSAIGDIGMTVDREPTYYLVDATVLRDAENSKREDHGLRIERVVENLTEKTRLGTAGAPLRLGDELLVTYRIQSDRQHHYLALVDELPAGIETVNFNLAQVAQFYALPPGVEGNTLSLSHSELRDRSANLYFDRMPEGAHTYSLLARVTAAGQFTWPAADLTPMYEPRFGALGGSGTLYSSEE